MYIKNLYANNKNVIIGSVILFAIIIFPLFLNIKITHCYQLKKSFFILELFGFIKLLSGYIQLNKNKLYIHISDTKAIIFEFIDLNGVKKSFKPLMDYHFITFQTVTEVGSMQNILTPLSFVFIANYVQSYIKWYMFNRKPYVNFDNNFNVYENEKIFNFYVKMTITLNILMILLSFIKIIMEKIIYEFRKIRGQN